MWRIECAADAEIVKRAEKRGAKKALIEQAAESAGVTTRQIYKNAEVAALSAEAEKIETGFNLEKKDYLVALTAPKEQRIEAVQMIAAKKQEDPQYSNRQAQADIKQMLPPLHSNLLFLEAS